MKVFLESLRHILKNNHQTLAICNKIYNGVILSFSDFLFGYVDNSDLLSGIAIWTLQTPLLFVLNTSSYTYSMFDVIDAERKELLDVDFQEVLDKVRSGTVEVNFQV